jgi:hypothetical protein
MKCNMDIQDDNGNAPLWLFGKPYSICWESAGGVNKELEANSIAETCPMMVI